MDWTVALLSSLIQINCFKLIQIIAKVIIVFTSEFSVVTHPIQYFWTRSGTYRIRAMEVSAIMELKFWDFCACLSFFLLQFDIILEIWFSFVQTLLLSEIFTLSGHRLITLLDHGTSTKRQFVEIVTSAECNICFCSLSILFSRNRYTEYLEDFW